MWKWILGALAAFFLLFGNGGCASTSGKGNFEANDVTMGTQFQIGWGTVLSIGFPGTVNGKGAIDAQHVAAPAVSPVATVPANPTTPPPAAPRPGG